MMRRRENVTDGASDHRGNDFFLRELCRRVCTDSFAVAKYGDAIGHHKHLVKLVRDVDHPDATDRKLFQDVKKRLDLRFGERRGRLIKHEDLSVLRKSLGDLDELLLPDAKTAYFNARVDRQVKIG